ncbi:MAG: large repetitive protein, partial [Gaiellaceae bacterium]|nr:large repetitive protein [Gaiellaceae bacterium]
NDAPVLDPSKSPALAAENEDAVFPSGAVGTPVSALVDFASPAGGVDNVTDVDSGALLGIAVTAANTPSGAWFYSTDNGASWTALGAVTNANARLLAADANTRLYFQPSANFNGTIATAITFRAWDQSAGANGALADTSSNGDTTAFSTATDTASLLINAVNDSPTDIGLSSSSVDENQPSASTVGTFSSTDIDSASFTYSFVSGTGSADNGSFQITGSTLKTNEVFDFETKSSYSIRVQTNDGSGGTFQKQFTITINNVNDPPTDIQLTPSSIAENQPTGTDIGTLTSSDLDAGDTHTYVLANTGCGGGPFADNSSFQIGGAGNDKVQSAQSFNFETKSSYTICVRSTDNGGLSFDKQFVISVTNVNEAPTDISLSNNNIDENKPSASLVGNLSQVGDPDSGETYTFTLLTSGCSGSFPDSSSFQISSAQLQSAVSFNYEVKSSYTICVRVNDPGSPNLSFEKPLTISINDVNDAPVDGNESANGVGNTLLEYGSVASPSSAAKKVLAGNLLAYATDEDQPAQTLSVSASDTSSANGGSVSVSSSGAFSYVPAAGFTGTDTFNYTVSDGNGGTDTSTVTVTVTARVWYVKNNAAAGGTGRSTDPFDTLAEADTAANATGDITYVYKGDGTTTGLTGGFSLLANQKLLGEPVNLVVGADTLATGTPANRPSLLGTVFLASGSRVEALDITGSAGAAIAGSNTGGSDVTNVNLSGAGGGVSLVGAAAGTFNFTNFAINTTGGTGFLVNSSGAPTINVGSGSTENVSATGGPAVDVRNGNTASSLTFDAVSSTNSSGAGINLDSNGATPFSASSGSISGAAGNAIDINGGSGNVTYPGTLGNGAGNTADITGRTGGAISLSGDINDTNDAGGGITMSGNAGGSTTFSGTTKTLNTGASAAFSSTGSGHTITFSGGGLNIDTTSGAGFTATGGGTVNVTGSVNTIDTTTGTALNVVSTNIGASGLNFKSISANGAVSGIVLNGTGSAAGLTVSGNGPTSLGGDGSGGTIQNTTGHGISLTSTRFPYFLNMNIQNTAGSGINGTQVTHFNFQFGTINNSGTGGAADDSNISFNDSTANANVTGDVHITGNVLTNARYHGVDIQNSTGTIDVADIASNTFTSSTSVASSLGSAVRLIALGSASSVANVTKASLDNNIISNFPSGAGFVVQGGNAADVGGAPAGTMGTPGSATNVISIDGNRMDGGLGGVGNQPDRFVTAAVNGRGQGNFDISNNGTLANPIAHIDGVVIELSEFGDATVTSTANNNRIVANNAVGSAGIGIGCDADSLTTTADTGTLTSTINNNNVSQTDGPGIYAIARNSSCTLNQKIQNNTVAAPATTNAARAGIRVDSGSAAGDTTLCLNISGNTTAGSTNTGTATTSPGINLRKQGTVTTTNSFAINGMAATATPSVENYVNSLNTSTSGTFGVGGTALLSATSGFSNCSLP